MYNLPLTFKLMEHLPEVNFPLRKERLNRGLEHIILFSDEVETGSCDEGGLAG